MTDAAGRAVAVAMPIPEYVIENGPVAVVVVRDGDGDGDGAGDCPAGRETRYPARSFANR